MSLQSSQCLSLKFISKTLVYVLVLASSMIHPLASQGKLHDGGLVAVKKLSLDKSHQGESEFLSEVKMITSTILEDCNIYTRIHTSELFTEISKRATFFLTISSSLGLVILGWPDSSLKMKHISALHSPELCKYSTNIEFQMKEIPLGAIDWLSTYSLLNFPLSPVQRLYSS